MDIEKYPFMESYPVSHVKNIEGVMGSHVPRLAIASGGYDVLGSIPIDSIKV